MNLPEIQPSTASAPVFASFWMGGFEGADHVNGLGAELDMAASSGHIDRLDEDYANAAARGIHVVRESIGWRLAEPAPGRFDLARAERIARCASRHKLQVLWTLMHYGTPADVGLLDDAMVERFAAFAQAVARALGPHSERPPVYNLINEIGFVAWAASATNLMHPYRGDPFNEGEGTSVSGYAIKQRLVRAVLAGMAAMRRVDPRARFLHVEPLVHVVAPPDRPDLAGEAQQISDYQWQAWDMIEGRTDPALGGNRGALDLIGVNHYHNSQWEMLTESRLLWHECDPRRRPFSELLGSVWNRYGRPVIVAETSHVGSGRARWLSDVCSEVREARRRGVRVDGICLYPLVDRPDWNDPGHWHQSGLWDVAAPVPPGHDPASPMAEAAPFARRLHNEYAQALAEWQAALPEEPERSGPEDVPLPPLVVFSHLRWAFVYQRPQQVMSRLGLRRRVLFIEEPLYLDSAEGSARIDRYSHGPGVQVLVPRTPVGSPGFQDDQLALIGPLLADYLATQAIEDYVVWFYTPMAMPLLRLLQPRAIVYDCMDELSAFKDAPLQLRQRESALLDRADIVFTGGPTLHGAKRALHPNVHCLPSAVDAPHFAPAGLDPASGAAHDADRLQGDLPHPRLGYFGVIDERIDMALVAALARAHPDWQIVMVGPVVKIDTADLPQGANLHWLGIQPYHTLPCLMAGWDVCLMPFELNAATRSISPTKTLEYLAGEKPVVSTAVPDVARLYSHVVSIARDTAGFIAACEATLAGADDSPETLRDVMRATVARASWDQVVETMRTLVAEVSETKASSPSTFEPLAWRSAAPVTFGAFGEDD